MTAAIPEILVVCTHNTGRSVAARVLFAHHGAGRVRVQSAGSAPGDTINPAVAELLTERGLDVSQEFPEHLTDEAAQGADAHAERRSDVDVRSVSARAETAPYMASTPKGECCGMGHWSNGRKRS